MYTFAKNNKTWTCPDSGLITVARIYADDETDKELIINEVCAQKYLEYKGFVVKHIDLANREDKGNERLDRK